MTRWAPIAVALATSSAIAADLPLYRDPARTVEERTQNLISLMTLTEKVGQLSQGVIRPPPRTLRLTPTRSDPVRSDRSILALGSDNPAVRNALQDIAVVQSRLESL
jgi:hypothetical protein